MIDPRAAVAGAIRNVRAQVRWKPGKDIIHLQKRRAMRHLPASATLEDYNALIQNLVRKPKARVLMYKFRECSYVVVRGTVEDRAWLAIFDLTGTMETAFPPDNIDGYLAHPGFTEIGTVEELLT